ncbi:MAG TPA: TIGR03617 family F420-dependent LLM class oxidoreductase [Candidatus Binataceae bacterium]|nr:TIGR03617 family F420-dependent LLM class oxidoreductase [Candidatus Binataceae bacterium]
MAAFKVEKVLNWGVAYSPEMQTGGKRPGPRWDTLCSQVREAEELGYDAVVGVETQHDPFLTLAIAAQEPSKLELVTGIALAFTKSPVSTAYIAWDLQAMSGGRLVIGLGSQVKGHVTRRFGMPWSKPAQRMKDYVNAMRACWNTWQNGVPLDFRSEHYNLSLMTPNFAPPPLDNPHIPIMIAAVQERMLQVAGESCDGVRLHGIVTRRYLDEIAFPNLKKGFARSGRPESEWSKFEISGGGFICTAPDRDSLAQAIEKTKSTIAFYGSTRSYRSSFELGGWTRQAEELHRMSIQQKWSEMPRLVSEEMVNAFAAVGTYADIASVLKKRFAGVNRIGFEIPTRNQHDKGVLREIIQDLHRG